MKLIIDDRIRNREVEFFNKFKLALKYDSVGSSFSFDFLYDSNNKEHVELGVIGHYHIARVEHNGQKILTGYVLSHAYTDSAKKQLAKFTGYSLPGVLQDCQIPTSSYPLQFDGLTLREIAQKVLSPFKLNFVVANSVSAKMDTVFDVTDANERQSVKDFLQELAAQKDIILSHDVDGNLLFTQTNTNAKPILNFDGGIPFESMTLSFNGQAMHSDITVMKQASSDGGNAGEVTIQNPYVPFVFRSLVKTQSSGDDNATEQAAKRILADELKNFQLVIKTDRWEIDGKIIMPNNIILVKNKNISLFNSNKWFIQEVTLDGDEKKTTATLKCVLPEVYNGEIPTYIFAGINLH